MVPLRGDGSESEIMLNTDKFIVFDIKYFNYFTQVINN